MNTAPSACDLTRRDLMDMDALLMQELGKFIQCSHHALYFPTTHAPRQPELLPRERRLLLPLYRQGSLLGVLMLHGVKVRDARVLLPQLPAIADLCLELLARVKATRVDAVTGLATENVLYGSMEDEAARVREIFADPSRGDGQSSPLHRLCMGLVLLHFSNGREIVGRMGFRFADELMRRAAEALQEELPSDVVAARVGRFGMALLLPSVSGRSACQKMAEAALARMAGAAMPAPLTGRTIRPRLSAGHAVYPQDMEGAELRLPMFEQARMLMERARLAARMTSQPGAPRVMPFARILQDGGTVLRALPQGRVRVGLGAQAKAREGMRFAVWGPSGQEGSGNQYKGEVVLLQVREFHSVAETVHLADATAPLEAGDRLSLLEVPSLAASHPHTPGGKTAAADASGTPGQEGTAAADKETEEASSAGSVQEVRARIPVLEDGSCAGIYGHGDFLHLFAQEKERTGRFVLAIVRVDVPHDARQEAALGECLAAWRQIPELCAGEPLAGLYGSNALIFFHADSSAETLLPHYAALCTRLEGAGLPVSAGLAGYPLLHYRKGEMPDCALKALEYAQLLPSPRAGLCNSLALNISADRRYALGDVFGAIDEYKLALLADAENVLARNSLGVCMAALGRYHEARRHFLEALRYKGDAGPERQERIAQTHYNLGTVCQQLGERRAAARYYRECIKDAPEHVYAHLRLGQLCEEGGRRNEARRFYELAAAIEDWQAEQAGEQRPSLARRYLARLAARQRHGGEARELLHDTLLRNPFDAAAMLLLARLYLDGDEDPAMAELLARKSVGLRDTPEGWQVLARALRALGREEEASLAEAHASVG
ncbi:tetratricopeptide repeat protein [Desulfovibrio piger]|uniref:tetratricopeptide repeat protein n=2 Tax=Desulfovibrio TaxID=872 RepID=UPI0026ED2E39|nr:diguanylate cyclase [Desulfovibrio piger]